MYDVYRKLDSLNPSKALSQNDLPVRLVREFAVEIAGPLTKIFNKCLRTGIFPTAWKMSTIVPIPKVVPCNFLDQLRSISLMPIFSKVFESF